MTPTVLLLQLGAAAASIFGYLLLIRDGLYGAGPTITVGQGLALFMIAIMHGWWLSPIAAATAGLRGALLALVILDVFWAFLGQGVAGYVFCAIPCPSMAPFGDIQRAAAVLFGGAAAWTTLRAYRAMPGPTQWAPPITAAVLIVVAGILLGANSTWS